MKLSTSLLGLILWLLGLQSQSTAQHREKELIFDSYPRKALMFPKQLKDVRHKSTLTEDYMGCVFKCTSVHWCRSINFKTIPQSPGQYACELLSLEQFTSNSYMKEDIEYTHYSVRNSCQMQPCKHDGQCFLQDDRQGYRCKCKHGFTGDQCEKVINECSSSGAHAHSCHADAICTNTEGSYTCRCKPSYQGDGRNCTACNISVDSDCRYVLRPDNCGGQFTSPGHPNNYNNSQSCYWRLISKGRVFLSFERFETEAKYDFVRVYDGTTNSSPLLGKFNGTNLPPNVTSTSNSMFVTFITDHSATRSGFRARFQAIV